MERPTMLLMGKVTISMAMFNSYVNVYQRVSLRWINQWLVVKKNILKHDGVRQWEG